RFAHTSASRTADNNRGSINAPNVMLCMPIGGASAARAATPPSPTRRTARTLLRASLRNRWPASRARPRPRERPEAIARARQCIQSRSLDAAPLRGWHSTGASGPRSCARGPPQCPVAADRRGDRLDMGARRVADTSPAHVDWFDYLVVKTALLPRAASPKVACSTPARRTTNVTATVLAVVSLGGLTGPDEGAILTRGEGGPSAS